METPSEIPSHKIFLTFVISVTKDVDSFFDSKASTCNYSAHAIVLVELSFLLLSFIPKDKFDPTSSKNIQQALHAFINDCFCVSSLSIACLKCILLLSESDENFQTLQRYSNNICEWGRSYVAISDKDAVLTSKDASTSALLPAFKSLTAKSISSFHTLFMHESTVIIDNVTTAITWLKSDVTNMTTWKFLWTKNRVLYVKRKFDCIIQTLMRYLRFIKIPLKTVTIMFQQPQLINDEAVITNVTSLFKCLIDALRFVTKSDFLGEVGSTTITQVCTLILESSRIITPVQKLIQNLENFTVESAGKKLKKQSVIIPLLVGEIETYLSHVIALQHRYPASKEIEDAVIASGLTTSAGPSAMRDFQLNDLGKYLNKEKSPKVKEQEMKQRKKKRSHESDEQDDSPLRKKRKVGSED
jgi:hypothetical protein